MTNKAKQEAFAQDDLPDGHEQVTDLEMLACLIFKMLDEGSTECVAGADRFVITLPDIALVMCDLAKANARNEKPTPATDLWLSIFKSDLALFRAAVP